MYIYIYIYIIMYDQPPTRPWSDGRPRKKRGRKRRSRRGVQMDLGEEPRHPSKGLWSLCGAFQDFYTGQSDPNVGLYGQVFCRASLDRIALFTKWSGVQSRKMIT